VDGNWPKKYASLSKYDGCQCGKIEYKRLGLRFSMSFRSPTIFALASAQGVSGVAVIRISGVNAFTALSSLTNGKALPEPRKTGLRGLFHPFDGHRKLDEAMVIRFQAPHSFTGENVVELHVHGGPVIVESVLQALGAMDGLRLAEPGEFTRRAFENNKLDLTEAEAIGDLIHAETQAQHELAIGQLDGALRKIYEDWRDRLSKMLAYCEAEIDFPDEDLPEAMIDTLRPKINELLVEFTQLINKGSVAEKLRTGLSIALIGAPNAGKSSLLNAMARDDVAIVTDMAGTTRDVLDVRLNIGGYAVTVSDTAGLRENLDLTNQQNVIEAEGIKRALKRADDADYKILVIDLMDDDVQARYDLNAHLVDETTFLVLNKCDVSKHVLDHYNEAVAGVFNISAITGAGLDDLLAGLKGAISVDFARTDHTVLTRARHKEALQNAKDSLERAISNPSGADELLAEDLRLVIRDLGRITGRVDVEDLLDIVFRDFCIGK
jgi:tRNA modification GTPase